MVRSISRWIVTSCVVLVGVIALVDARPVAAQNSALTWDRCPNLVGSHSKKTFACDSDDAAMQMVVSMTPSYDMPDAVGAQAILDVRVGSGALPDWWAIAPGQCRSSAVTVSGYVAGVGDASLCPNAWARGGPTGSQLVVTENYLGSPNRIRLEADWAVTTPVGVTASKTWVALVLTLSTAHTVTEACAGCATPVCMELASMDLFSATPGYDQHLSPMNNYLITLNDDTGSTCVVGSRRATWGTVKALYR